MSAILPSEQTEQQVVALGKFLDERRLCLSQPCDCGGHIRHHNGGNYHQLVKLALDAGKAWISRTNTSDYSPPENYQEISFAEALEEVFRLAARGYRF